MTTVINRKDAPKGWRDNVAFVFIGRMRNGRVNPDPFKEGGLGNSFKVEDHGREECIALFRESVEKRVTEDPDFRRRVRGLSGKTLVCYCKPEACHGDVLAEIADRLASQTSAPSRTVTRRRDFAGSFDPPRRNGDDHSWGSW